ncbi:MAG: OB-fold nucleic acid binding domain-containing protein [Candidatus Hodarchaeota archaeon]
MNSNFEDNINRIINRLGISKEELQNRIEEIKKEFDGLLSDEGALAIIAKDGNVEIEQDAVFFQRRLDINELEVGMQTVAIAGRVEGIFPVREFKRKTGEDGKVVNLILRDKTGNIRVALWDDHVKNVEDGSIKIGKIIELKNCYVKEGWQGRNEVNLGNRGEIELNPEVNEEDFPEISVNFVKIGEIKSDMSNVSISGRIIELSEVKDITTRDGRQTQLQEMTVADETGQIRVPLWGEKINNIAGVSKGDIVQIINGYTRNFQNRVNLNIGNLSSIEVNPEEVQVPEIEDLEIAKEVSSTQPQIKIRDLTPDSKNVNLFGKCIELGEVREVKNDNKVMSVKLGDETGIVNLSVWNEDIEKMKKGESFLIINGYVTTFQNKIQLNTGRFGKLEVSEQKITKVDIKNIVSEREITPTRKKIIELSENQLIEVRGTITDILSKKLTYNACPKCRKGVIIENEEISCPNCDVIPNYETRMLYSFIIDDGTSNIRVTVGGETAENLIKILSEENQDFPTELDESTSIQLVTDQILGKEINVIGRTRRKSPDPLEILAQKIEKPNVLNEVEKTLKEFN